MILLFESLFMSYSGTVAACSYLQYIKVNAINELAERLLNPQISYEKVSL